MAQAFGPLFPHERQRSSSSGLPTSDWLSLSPCCSGPVHGKISVFICHCKSPFQIKINKHEENKQTKTNKKQAAGWIWPSHLKTQFKGIKYTGKYEGFQFLQPPHCPIFTVISAFKWLFPPLFQTLSLPIILDKKNK